MNFANVNCKCDPNLIIDAQINDDSFETLFRQFSPVYLKLWNEFYLNDMELCDWGQEAAIVFYYTIRKYDFEKRVTFGSFYKTNLRNRLYDILRKKRAKKRVPDRMQASFSNYAEFYAETIQDETALNPLSMCEFYENVSLVCKNCSRFEREVLVSALRHNSLDQIANEQQVSAAKVNSALLRCRRKYRQQTCLTTKMIDDKVKCV